MKLKNNSCFSPSFNRCSWLVVNAYSSFCRCCGYDGRYLWQKVLVGYWHNWASKGRDGYKQGTSASLNLSEVNQAYNVVPVSFMKSDGTTRIPTFKPYNQTDTAFRQEVAQLNSQGRAVLLALGGADAHIQLVKGDEQAFANEIIRQVETYGFDGLDIDLEQLAITVGDNQTVIPAALKIVKDHYRAQGKISSLRWRQNSLI